MAESVRLLSSLAIDGRALRCEHAVLLVAEPPADEWFVSLLDVAEADLQRLPGRHLASIADTRDAGTGIFKNTYSWISLRAQ